MGHGHVGTRRGAEGIEIRLLGDEADGAAHRARAVEGALGTAQHLDAIQIEQLRLHGAVELAVADGHRYLVDVDADRRRSRHGADAANLDVVETRSRAGGERDAGHRAGDVVVVGDMMLGELRAADRRYADRDVLDVFGALLRRDDDLLQLARGRFGLPAGRGIARGRLDRERRRNGEHCQDMHRERRARLRHSSSPNVVGLAPVGRRLEIARSHRGADGHPRGSGFLYHRSAVRAA